MGAERQGQDKDLEVTGELDLLSKTIENILSRTDELEGRLQKIMVNPPTTKEETQQDVPQLCDVAHRIRAAKYGVQKVNHILVYILENLQL